MSTETAQVPTPQQIRQHVHRMWGAVAESWGVHADHVEQRSQLVTRLMIEAVGPVPGDEVLELACGAGGLGLAIADSVAPRGRVVLSDAAPQMVEIAAARASRRAGKGGTAAAVSARVIDLEQIDLPDASFDIVVCREGLMFALDPVKAASEIARVLRPGGRVAVTVWGPRDRNPWLGVLADAVQEHTGSPVPPAGFPGPFALGADGALAQVLASAALENVRVKEVPVPTHDASFEDYWDLRTDLAGPLKRILGTLPPEDLAAIREKVRSRLARYQTTDGLRIPGVAYVSSARRPDDAHPSRTPAD
jgi:ubiquinone/menaquinone biosynthesis C-methylase UbiE